MSVQIFTGSFTPPPPPPRIWGLRVLVCALSRGFFRSFSRLIFSGALLLLVAACGGGGSGASPSAQNPQNPVEPAPSIVYETVYDSQMETLQDEFNIAITPSFVARDKEDAKQILEALAGRTLTDEEVDAILAILDRFPVSDDCAAESEVLDGNTCSGCSGETPILYGNECGPSAEMCVARNQILRGAACGAPSNAECIARSQLLNDGGTACRPLNILDCQVDGQTLNDAGDSCRALVVEDCAANDQILSGGSCLSCDGQTPARVGNVCGPTAEICTAQNQVLRGAVCESPTDAECRANEQRLNTATNICRALIAGDCLAGEVFDGGVCRALLVADCTANDEILSGNSCVACSGETPARYGNECGPTADMCLERKQVLRNAACGAPSDAECVARKQLLNDARNACRLFTNEDCIAQGELLNAGEDGCRPLEAEDCASDDQILSNGSCVSCGGETPVRYGNVCGPTAEACVGQNQILRGAVCGAPTADECITREQRLNTATNRCRALTNTDCQTNGQILRDGSCITQTDADCRVNNQRLDNVGACRALTNTDCQEEGKTLRNGSCDTPTDEECRANEQRFAVDVCRALTNADCQADGQILRDRSCGAPTADECAARNQRLATATNTCRALTNADCEAAGEKLNDAETGCRALVTEDCTADGKILSGSSCSSCAGQTPVRYENECGPSAEICTASNQILRGAVCDSPTVEECGARNQRLNHAGNACRALIDTDCAAGQTLNEAGNACRALAVADCTAEDKVLSNGSCVSCSAVGFTRYENTCGPSAEMCAEIGQVLHGTACVAPTESDCTARGQRLTLNVCRPLTGLDCEAAGQILNDAGTGCRAFTADDCAAENKILSGSSCSFCSGQTPVRYENECGPSAEICVASNQILRGTACGSPTAEECTARNQRLNYAGTACRPLNHEDCEAEGNALNSAGNGCRAVVAADCAADDKIFSGGSCLSCSGQTPARYGNVCGPTADMCEAQNQVLHNAVCTAPTDAECRIRNKRLDAASGTCRNPTGAECQAAGQVLNIAGNGCVTAAGSCSGDTPVMHYDGRCRARSISDCTGDTPQLENGVCRVTQAKDCELDNRFDAATNSCKNTLCYRYSRTGGQVWTGNGCRNITSADCAQRGEFFDGRYCRERRNSDCPANNIVGVDGECRAVQAADCALHEEWTGDSCRRACDSDEVRVGDSCRQETASDCAFDEYWDERANSRRSSCRSLGRGDCPASHPIYDYRDGLCRKATQEWECRSHQKKTPVVTEGGTCRAEQPGDCFYYQIFDNEKGKCRRLRKKDCAADEVLWNGVCISPPTSPSDCPNVRPVLDNGVCRAATSADECRNNKVFVSATGTCRKRNESECTDTENWNGNKCLAACAETETYNGYRCRPTRPTDCEGDKPVFEYSSGTCRAEQASDCDPTYETWSGSACELTRDAAREEANSRELLDGINASYAHERGYFGQGVTVGVSDLILDVSVAAHADLAENYVELSFPETKRFRYAQKNIQHGVNVAGVIAAAKNSVGIIGVAPQAKWAYHRALGNTFLAMIDHNIPIVNLSYESFLGNGVRTASSYFTTGGGQTFPIASGFEPLWGVTVTSRFWWEKVGNTVEIRATIATARELLSSYADYAEDSDSIFVWAAGNDGWHKDNEWKWRDPSLNIEVGLQIGLPFQPEPNFSDARWGALADMPENIPSIDSMAPVLSPKLRDNWLAVVAFDENRAGDGKLAYYSNGCGAAKMWCLAAPGRVTTAAYNEELNKETYEIRNGTSFATPHVSGALALLKSAAPLLPMTVIHGIILTTATDYGAPGVDDVFGWGLVNVSAGITLIEGIKTAAPDGTAAGAGINLRDLQFTLPERFSYLRERLGESAAVALEITDGTYYNLPLSKIAGISTSGDDNKQQAEASLADLEMSFVEYADKTHSALPFFARDGGGGGVLLQKREEGLHPFLAFDGGNNLAESAYQQVGFRWQKTRARFGVVAEASHIRESEAFWGVDFGALGDMSAQTEQAKLLLSGELSEEYGWSGYAGYEHARARGLLSNSSAGNFIAGIEGAAASGWLAGLEKVNIFHRDDRLRLSARQETRISGGGLLLKTPQATGGFTESFYGEIEQEVKLRSTLIPLREESSIIWGLGYASSIGSSEWAAAVEHDEQGKTSISAKWGYAF